MPFVLVWTGENECFRKRWRHELDNQSPTENENVSYLIAIVDGRKRFENASVDADICIRFRWIKNGGMRKRISVDVAQVKSLAVLKKFSVGIMTLRDYQKSVDFRNSCVIPKII